MPPTAGAEIRTRTKCTSARRVNGNWEIKILPEGGKEETIQAKALINAAGPWVSEVLGSIVGRNNPDKIRMVKGSHIVVDRLYDHDRCYIFQNADGRICFAIPYEQNFTLIGTTDEDHKGEPGNPQITDSEIDYLLSSTSEYFKLPITREQVRWTYSGIRPLYDDGASKAQEATRDYVLKLDAPSGQAPLLSVFGGKITTFRKLAESVLEKLVAVFPEGQESRGRRARHCPAATFPSMKWKHALPSCNANIRSSRRRMCGGFSAPMAPRRRRCSTTRALPRTWARALAP